MNGGCVGEAVLRGLGTPHTQDAMLTNGGCVGGAVLRGPETPHTHMADTGGVKAQPRGNIVNAIA